MRVPETQLPLPFSAVLFDISVTILPTDFSASITITFVYIRSSYELKTGHLSAQTLDPLFFATCIRIYHLNWFKRLKKCNILQTVVEVFCRNSNKVLSFCFLEKKFALILIEISPELQI